MIAGAPAHRGLVIDLSGAQSLHPTGAAMARFTGECAVALLAMPGVVRALLLNPSLPLPGSLHPALLSSPLLRWNTATELRRTAASGPLAYLMLAPPGVEPAATLLPAAVADGEIPLVMVLHGGLSIGDGPPLSNAALGLYRHADLVLVTGAAADDGDAAALDLDPSRVLLLAGAADSVATTIVHALNRLDGSGAPGAAASPSPPRDHRRTRRTSAGPGRLHLALVGALPPSTGPSARANARLAEALASRCHLDLTSDDRPDRAWLDRLDARHLPVGALTRYGLPSSYDAVVHCVGGSADDLPALRSARRIPGVLWLHDVRLAGPHRAEAMEAADPAAALAGLLRRMYSHRAPAPVLDGLDAGDPSAFSPAAEQRYGLLLTAEVVRQARAVVVGSAAAARRLRLDQGASAPCPPITVIEPDDPDAAADRLLALVAGLAAAGEAVA